MKQQGEGTLLGEVGDTLCEHAVSSEPSKRNSTTRNQQNDN
jgi:hypothetical protein